MPTIQHAPVTLPTWQDFDGVRVRQWTPMALGDVGEPIILARFNDKTVQVSGNFGAGGKVVLEGSIDGVNYAPIKSVFGGTLELTSAQLQTITEVPVYMRPNITAGDGTTSLTVSILVR
jgi:hypothetical protein